LLGAACGVGHFDVIRFREDARKLSHVLEADDLQRFVAGLIQETDCALTLAQVVRALVLRFDLEPAGFEPLEDHEEVLSAQVDIVDDVSAGRAARAVVAELTQRQVAILQCQLRDLNVRETAPRSAWRPRRSAPSRRSTPMSSRGSATRRVRAAAHSG